MKHSAEEARPGDIVRFSALALVWSNVRSRSPIASGGLSKSIALCVKSKKSCGGLRWYFVAADGSCLDQCKSKFGDDDPEIISRSARWNSRTLSPITST